MVLMLMSEKNPAEVTRRKVPLFESLDNPPAGNPGIDEDCRRANLDKGGIPLLPLARTEILNDVFIEKYLVFSQLTQDHVLGLMYHHWKQP